MQFAICNETFLDWPLDRAFGFARECGYQGIEIAPFTLGTNAYEIDDSVRREVCKVAAAESLQVIGLHWLLAKTEGYHLTSPDESIRKQTAEYLGALARLCRDLGGSVLVLGSPQQRNLLPGITHAQGVAFAADVISQALPTLQDQQVILAMEPLGPQEGDFLLTADSARTLIDQVASPWCRLHLDVKAMSSEGTAIPEIIQKNSDLLEHFHANDANRRGPGMGEIDFVPILRSLQEIGYKKWVSVEVFDYEPGVESLVGDSIRYLQTCLGNQV